MMNISAKPWAAESEAVVTQTQTDTRTGLTTKEAKDRLNTYGPNIFEDSNEKSVLTIFSKQFASPLIIILIIAALITGALSEWLDTAIIAFAVIINAILGFIQEYKAEKAITNLRSYITHRTRVIRDGIEQEIDPAQLVPGDIVHIIRGKRITADARVVSETEFAADESILTGESLPVAKSVEVLPESTDLPDRINMIYAGTLGVGGEAYAVVTATGYKTEIGTLAHLVANTESETTPLQKALSKLTWVIIVVTTLAVIGIFTIGILQEKELYEMLLISIAVLVGSVPEALPIGLTAILAIGVERIAKKKGIMRSLTAAETLGSTTLIITDKTGTLTQSRMQLVDISTRTELAAKDYELSDAHDFSDTEKELLRLARLCSDVSIANPLADPNDWKISGTALETNITRVAAANNITLSNKAQMSVQHPIPFNSKHKFSVAKVAKENLPDSFAKAAHVHIVMGAPDILIERSDIDEKEKHTMQQHVADSSTYGRRVLGLAYFVSRKKSLVPDDVNNLTFIGVLGFQDPIRPEVPAAIDQIESYGTRIIMATGDLPGTALSIAREVGWTHLTEANVLTGSELKLMTDEELEAKLDDIHIYARVTPEDKLRITRLYQSRNEIVAMTGDGVNDAPSLKAANIGIAVGSGSDVAKGVSDLILLDDNFHTIVATIEEGKQILANIKKMFVYLMSNALDELILIGGAILVGVALPLNALQIIWVNLFTGSLPAIAFAFDRQKMITTTETSREFFSRRVLFLTIVIGIAVSLMLFSLYLWLLSTGMEHELASSILFASFGTYTIFIAFSFIDLTRPIYSYSLVQNKLLLAGFSVGAIMMLLPFFVPFLRDAFGVVPLPNHWIAFVLLWSGLNILMVEITKWLAGKYTSTGVDKSI